jgi:hypothetical protein
VDLDLRLSSEVKIATSGQGVLDHGSRTYGMTARPFHGDGHWKPWVVKSHGYELRVDLDIAPELMHDDEAFAQHVAARLKQFKAGDDMYQLLEYTDTLLDLGNTWASSDISRDTPQ